MLLTGNYLFAQVIPVGFKKKGGIPLTENLFFT